MLSLLLVVSRRTIRLEVCMRLLCTAGLLHSSPFSSLAPGMLRRNTAVDHGKGTLGKCVQHGLQPEHGCSSPPWSLTPFAFHGQYLDSQTCLLTLHGWKALNTTIGFQVTREDRLCRS
ncbi:MAG: hypothetical protein J3Q66DRAFT_92170 [Benniella sp.]|nr:MAG: hypothetical protein J3Q66DRAFT_92170 [Benniella sp.]